MEISFERNTTCSAELSAKDERKLAKHLGITVRRMEILDEEGDLLAEHEEAIVEWLNANPHLVTVTDEEDMENIEINF